MLRLTAVSVLLLTVFASETAPHSARIDLSKLGPQVGERVPEFRLMDQQGTVRTLASIMGPKGAMLVFSRSIDWCPYCKTQVLELQGRADELRKRGLGLAVITYDSPALQAEFSKRRGIALPLLSDAGSATIRAFGILNTTVDAQSQNYGIPFPGTFMLDPRGVVTARFFEDAYQERNTVANIMLKLDASSLERRAKRITTDHLKVTTYVSDDVIAPGTLFSIVFDVEPRPRMHVYAPGAESYKIIGFELDSNPLLVVRPMSFPKPEVYFFKPLNERVPVYQKPFRLMQELALSASRDHREAISRIESLTITGRLNYQACDDAVCFIPASLPVSYTVRVRLLDTERAPSQEGRAARP
jgi:peroxiredoxin